MQAKANLGTDKMLPLILRMTLPGVVAQLVNLLYSIVDRIFIGHIEGIGTNALAGVGVTGSTIILITAFSAIVGMGGAPLAAIALGRGDKAKAENIMGNGLTMLVVSAVVLSFVVYVFMEPILLFTGASVATLGYAVDYLSVYLLGTVFVLVAVGLNPFIVIQGRAAEAMWAVVIGALINIALDYVFIFQLGMGVRGAALATVISQGCSAVWVMWCLFCSRSTLKFSWAKIRPRLSVILPVLALGASPFVMASTEALVGFVLNGSLKQYGDMHISSMAVIQSALLASSIPLTGFSQGFMPIISYNYGAGDNRRVRQCLRYCLIIMGVFNFVLIVSMILFPRVVASVFTSDIELIDMVAHNLPIFFMGLSLFGFQRACQSTFVALGQAKISIFVALLRKVILLIPFMLLLPRWLGVMGLYWAEAVSDAMAAVCCLTIFSIFFPKVLARNAK